MLFGILRRPVALVPRGIVRGDLLAGPRRGDAPPQDASSCLEPGGRLDRARQRVAILRIHHCRVSILLHSVSTIDNLARSFGRRLVDLSAQDETRASSGSLKHVHIVNDSRGTLPGLRILAKLSRLLRRFETIDFPLDARWYDDVLVDLQRRRAVVALATLHVVLVVGSSLFGPRRRLAHFVDVDALTYGDQTAAAVVPTILLADIHPK